jgi:hypothetical protein
LSTHSFKDAKVFINKKDDLEEGGEFTDSLSVELTITRPLIATEMLITDDVNNLDQKKFESLADSTTIVRQHTLIGSGLTSYVFVFFKDADGVLSRAKFDKIEWKEHPAIALTFNDTQQDALDTLHDPIGIAYTSTTPAKIFVGNRNDF